MKFKEVPSVFILREEGIESRCGHIFSEVSTAWGYGELGFGFFIKDILMTKYWIERQSNLEVFESKKTWKGSLLL